MANGHTSGRANAGRNPRRRVKRTFSLSAEALAYLDGLAKEHKSTSEALDRLIREKKAQAEKARISAGIRNYYDSISEQERAENLAWGELAGSHFLKG
jgi:predicted CopG family antitoxin